VIFVDTCILIDHINGKIAIHDHDKPQMAINSIVENEIIVGARDKRDLATTNKILSDFPLLDLDQDIMNTSTVLLNRYALSHGMSIYDAIIAATCIVYDLPLWTHNKKDFRFLDIELV